jgi:hypothetical protein
MATISIIRSWDFPDPMRQTPGGRGEWGGHTFVDGAVDGADFVIVLNQPAEHTTVVCDPARVFAIIQEPPTPFHTFLHTGQPGFARIYTSHPRLAVGGGRYRGSQPALSWHVDKTFDALTAGPDIPPKTSDLSWITSTLAFLPGHKVRVDFLERLRPSGIADLFGRGLNPVADKWTALGPYRYSIVFENHEGPYYWSEKLADCYLAGAMPIYVGCTNLADYFPEGAFVRIDPKSADPVAAVRAIIESDLAERNREHLVEARRRCLYEHQLFPFVVREIEAETAPAGAMVPVRLRRRKLRHPVHFPRAVWYWKVKPKIKSALGIGP